MENKKILIVEDDRLQSASMELTLTRNGYDCKAVASGEEAIAILSNYEPDCILMDIGLDGNIDGISTAGIIRRQYIHPIIYVSEQNNPGVLMQAMGAAPQNYLNKPYTDAALLQAIEAALFQPAQSRVANPAMPLGERVADGIFVYFNNEYVKVLFSDILYLEANSMSTTMYCAMNKQYTISLSSNNVVTQLACPGIVRSNKSYYVNIHRIDSIKHDELIINKKSIPMGKSFKTDVMSRVKKITSK